MLGQKSGEGWAALFFTKFLPGGRALGDFSPSSVPDFSSGWKRKNLFPFWGLIKTT